MKSISNNVNHLREFFFNKAQESFVIFDNDLNFIDVNEAFLSTLHFTREDIIGKNVREISQSWH